MVCMCGTNKKYLPKEEEPPDPVMEFRHVPEPQLSEVTAYLRQRQQYITLLHNTAEVRAELTRDVSPTLQPLDMYPKGRLFLNDEEYLLIVKDLLNLSNILDDMEQTGIVPYPNRTAYYNLYGKLYRMLAARAKS